MKTLGRIVLILAGFVLIALISIVVRFSLPGTPSSSRSMRFDGYILLPKNGNFSIYDYLSIVDRNIYLTEMSSGSVVRISLSSVGGTQLGEFKGEPCHMASPWFVGNSLRLSHAAEKTSLMCSIRSGCSRSPAFQ
jgi:hypothetical protein